jgi:hypothetical protein
MAPWRIAGASALTATFALMGVQVQRLTDDRAWSNSLMWMSVFTGVVAAGCVLGWTWTTTDNARRLVEPANRANLPDPGAAVRTWIPAFVLVAIAVGVVVMLGVRSGAETDGTVSAVPLAIAVAALLLTIPMTYRPMNHLAGVVRQVGGYTVRVSQWMWVPVVLALVGVGSLVALRYAGVDDASTAPTGDEAGVPLWVIAVVAVAPFVITILLAWRAASSVEDAIAVAAARRLGVPAPTRVRAAAPLPVHRRVSSTTRIQLLPGAEPLRLVMVTLMAGQSLLSFVGAIVTAMLWLDSRDAGVLLSERRRVWDVLDALRVVSGGVIAALLVAVIAWTMVTVVNVRRTTGRRFNPLIAASCWPAAAATVWWIADRMTADESIGRVVLGFVAQAAALAVPFLVLERSATAVGARRTPFRIVYVLGVVMLIHVQGLGGLLQLPDSVATTEIGRLSAYLAIGALIQLCSTLAVTDACRSLSHSCRHEADHHNMLVDARGDARDPHGRPARATTSS